MNITDPIADLPRIRNGQKASKEVVEVPAGKIRLYNQHKSSKDLYAFKCIRTQSKVL